MSNRIEVSGGGRSGLLSANTSPHLSLTLPEQQLATLQRFESMGVMMAGVAHELNNLLTLLGTALSIASEADASQRLKLQGDVQCLLERGRTITGVLLEQSRCAHSAAPVEPGPLLARLGLFYSRSYKKIRFQLDLQDQDLRVFLDPTRFEQAVLNLLINASHATQEQGHVRLQMSRWSPDQLRLLTGELVTTSFCCIEITDDGVGIPREMLSLIFEPFFTTKPPGQGTGLGLPMVQELMEDCGGRIHIDSQPGEGTTFRLLFPEFHQGV